MKNAPQIGATVLLTSLTTPDTTTGVKAVLGYDPAHDAWQVEIATMVTAWIRARDQRYMVPPGPAWQLYDIRSPLAA